MPIHVLNKDNWMDNDTNLSTQCRTPFGFVVKRDRQLLADFNMSVKLGHDHPPNLHSIGRSQNKSFRKTVLSVSATCDRHIAISAVQEIRYGLPK